MSSRGAWHAPSVVGSLTYEFAPGRTGVSPVHIPTITHSVNIKP